MFNKHKARLNDKGAGTMAQDPVVVMHHWGSIRGKRRVIIEIASLLIILGVGIFFVWNLTSSSTDSSKGQSAICKDSVIVRYNSAVKSKTPEDYERTFKAFATEIEALPGQRNDQNCAFMLYTYYAYKDDAIKARLYVDTFKALEKKGKSLNDMIVNPINVQQMEDHVKSLESNDNPTAAGGSG